MEYTIIELTTGDVVGKLYFEPDEVATIEASGFRLVTSEE